MPTSEPLESFLTEVFSESWNVFKADPVLYILGGVVMVLTTLFTLGLLGGPVMIGFLRVVGARRRGEQVGVGDIFGLAEWGGGIALAALLFLGVSIGSLFFALPGMLFAYFSVLALPAMAFEDDGPVQAVRTSVQLVRDNAVHVLVLVALMSLLGLVGGALWIGALFTAPFLGVVITVAYQRLTGIPRAQGGLGAQAL